MVKARLTEADCKNGYLFDGFPRTIPQAEAMKGRAGVPIDYVVEIDVADEEIVKRMSAAASTWHLAALSRRVQSAQDSRQDTSRRGPDPA